MRKHSFKNGLIGLYRATVMLLWISLIVVAGVVLLVRYVLLPNANHYRQEIANQITQVAGVPIQIGQIEASWHGLNPHLTLRDVVLLDQQRRPALSLQEVETGLSWLSIPLLTPRLSQLLIQGPELTIRRERNGDIFVAGFPVKGEAKPELANWILKQSRLDILDAKIVWQDEMRQAPPLILEKLQFQLLNPPWESLIGHHRFGLRAQSVSTTTHPIDVRGNFYGRDAGDFSNWRGTLYARVEGTNLAVWRQWLDYPVDLREGTGAARFWLDIAGGAVRKLTTDVLLANVAVAARPDETSAQAREARLEQLAGRLRWQQSEQLQSLSGEHLHLSDGRGLEMRDGRFSWRRYRTSTMIGKLTQKFTAKPNAAEDASQSKVAWQSDGELELDAVSLAPLRPYLHYLPVSPETQEQIARLNPRGAFRNLALSWHGDQAVKPDYAVRADFSELGVDAAAGIPGISGLAGNIEADEKAGSLRVQAKNTVFDYPDVMRSAIPVTQLEAQIKWQKRTKDTEIQLRQLQLTTPHLSGTLSGSYWHVVDKPGRIELNGKFTGIDAKEARFYYPGIMGKDTLHWLDTAILGGHCKNIVLTMQGDLAEFPWEKNRRGLFRVTADMVDGEIQYAPHWPKIEALQASMLFEGNHMEINATGGHMLGNQIIKTRAVIPVLTSDTPQLNLTGETQGQISEAIRFINGSDLKPLMRGFTDNLKTSGLGKLTLELAMPLHDTDASKVKGSYLMTNGTLQSPDIPDISRINGKLEFTESVLKAQNLSAWAYGGPMQLNLTTGSNHLVRITAKGTASDLGLRQGFAHLPLAGFLDKVTGAAEWTAGIDILDKQLDITVNSNMVGLASSLPAPLSKASLDTLPLHFEKRQPNASQDSILLTLGNGVSFKVLRSLQQGELRMERGEVALNVPLEMPAETGIRLRGNSDTLDWDEWTTVLDRSTGKTTDAKTTEGVGISRVDIGVNRFDVIGRRLNAVKLNARAVPKGWNISLQSREVNGDLQWISPTNPQDNGKLIARLRNLIMPAAVPNTAELRTQGGFKQQAQEYPALDVVAESFESGKRKFGKLEIIASEHNDDWSIERLRISNPDSVLTAEGEWHNWKRNPNTRLTMAWDINDLGKTLERYGYPDTIKGGDADLTGQLKWTGSPHEFNVVALSGNLQLDARKGQILKIQPGVGRLFSVLSLQNLPRRLVLDFRDVFSSGFTFDKVAASVRIDQGVMRSEDFKMEGPTARVEMRGETNLQNETQHLHVKVTPYVSDSLSLAALAGGPVVGAAAFVAQKLLKDPINKLASDEYEIVGTWDDPQELKSGDKKNKSETPAIKPLGK